MEELGVRMESSLCFDCQKARADRCAWVARLEPVWKRVEEKTIFLAKRSALRHKAMTKQ